MKISDFDYELPEEFIAQTPVEPRDASRLLVLDRRSGEVEHAHFCDLPRYLLPGDVLVLNETRVLRARLYAWKLPGGGKVEILLLQRRSDRVWEALVGGKGLVPGKRFQVEGGSQAEILDSLGGARRLVQFDRPVEQDLERAGHIPLPPYIHVPLTNPERYQTVYARQPGSAAAPTAGLHFTPRLIDGFLSAGIKLVRLTLHVGLDTFAPVTEEDPQEHQIHNEWCQLSLEAADEINRARHEGGRIFAVGTTSVRTLESAARLAGPGEGMTAFEGSTDLFIVPGYQFKMVDAMITNFHLPRSTLIMLVSAFAGRERILNTYEIAKQNGYRFYSFGDAMLIL